MPDPDEIMGVLIDLLATSLSDDAPLADDNTTTTQLPTWNLLLPHVIAVANRHEESVGRVPTQALMKVTVETEIDPDVGTTARLARLLARASDHLQVRLRQAEQTQEHIHRHYLDKIEQFLLNAEQAARPSLQKVARDYLDVINANEATSWLGPFLDPGYYEIVEWREDLVIRRNGDTTITRDLMLKAGERGVGFVRNRILGSRPPADPNDVTCLAQLLDDKADVVSDLTTVSSWKADDGGDSDVQQEVLVHLPRTVPEADEFGVRLQWSWPGFAEHFLHGAKEPMTWRFIHPVRSFDCVVTVTADARASGTLRARPIPPHPRPIVRARKNGSYVVTYRLPHLDDAESNRLVGFTMQLDKA